MAHYDVVLYARTTVCIHVEPLAARNKEEAQKQVFALWDKDPERFISAYIGGAEALDWTVEEEDIEVKSVESPQSQGSYGVTSKPNH
jgi:hypothetical protein